MIDTRRLTLTPAAPQHLLTLIEQPEAFEASTGLRLAPGLREFYVSGEVSPAWLSALRKSSDPDPWRHGFFIVHREAKSVIGTAGFKGPADEDGMVEIACGVAPGFQGHGYATEAAAALVDYAFATPGAAVVARTTSTSPVPTFRARSETVRPGAARARNRSPRSSNRGAATIPATMSSWTWGGGRGASTGRPMKTT